MESGTLMNNLKFELLQDGWLKGKINGAFKLPGLMWYLATNFKIAFFSIRASDSKNLEKSAHFIYILSEHMKNSTMKKFTSTKFLSTHQVGLPYTCATCMRGVKNSWIVPLTRAPTRDGQAPTWCLLDRVFFSEDYVHSQWMFKHYNHMFPLFTLLLFCANSTDYFIGPSVCQSVITVQIRELAT